MVLNDSYQSWPVSSTALQQLVLVLQCKELLWPSRRAVLSRAPVVGDTTVVQMTVALYTTASQSIMILKWASLAST